MIRVNRAVLIATLAVAYPSYGWAGRAFAEPPPMTGASSDDDRQPPVKETAAQPSTADQTVLNRNPFLSIEEQTVRPVEDRPIQRTIKRLTDPPLTAIVSHSGDTVAVIGGQIVRVGDQVESKDVVEITAEQVWLQDHDTRYLLELSDVVEFTRDRGVNETAAGAPGLDTARPAELSAR